jgi:hypothetical protein
MGVIVPEIGFGGNLCNPARSLQFRLHAPNFARSALDG